MEDLWLVAIFDEVPDDEVRRWWNSKDTPLLDRLVASAPRFRLGTIVTAAEDHEPASPTRRVFDLLFLRGTCPEDFGEESAAEYVLPRLDLRLQLALLTAFSPHSDDLPMMEAAPLSALSDFLNEYEGARLATYSPTDATLISFDTHHPTNRSGFGSA
ncbi:hypothetical protein [Actinoplanes cyaneus]|nr:hypothetical protein [Actinoplanes cyaneus]